MIKTTHKLGVITQNSSIYFLEAIEISHLYLWTGLWDWTQRKLRSSFWVSETTQEIYSFHLPSMRVFSCNTAVISMRICTWLCFIIHMALIILSGPARSRAMVMVSYGQLWCQNAHVFRFLYFNYVHSARLISTLLIISSKPLTQLYIERWLLELFLCCYQVWLGWCNYSADRVNMDSHFQTDYLLSVWEWH